MEKFYLENPSIERKIDAIDYINEHLKYNSNINGTGSLNRYLSNYEGWLERLDYESKIEPSESLVPARTFFLVRESDKKIVGMINIRLALNDNLREFGGNIGYGIRPLERGKGYNKINLYLALKVCKQYGISEVLLDAALDNLPSWKTMEALGGVRIREYFDKKYTNKNVVCYKIDVDASLKKYSDIYEEFSYQNKGEIK